jgi:two-component system chemotaxis response regulator CheB
VCSSDLDKESSVVHGMPGEAIKLGAASHVLPPDKIAEMLRMLLPGGSQK